MFADIIKLPSLVGVDDVYYIDRSKIVYFHGNLQRRIITIQLQGYGDMAFQFNNQEEFNQALSLLENGK